MIVHRNRKFYTHLISAVCKSVQWFKTKELCNSAYQINFTFRCNHEQINTSASSLCSDFTFHLLLCRDYRREQNVSTCPHQLKAKRPYVRQGKTSPESFSEFQSIIHFSWYALVFTDGNCRGILPCLNDCAPFFSGLAYRRKLPAPLQVRCLCLLYLSKLNFLCS